MKKVLPVVFCFLFCTSHFFSQTWDTLAVIPYAHTFPVVVELNGEIHVIGGGGTGGATKRHERYKPSTNAWDTLASVPYLAQQPAGVALNGKIHYFGGGYPNSGTPLLKHFVYDPVTNSWNTGASLLVARVIMEAGTVNGKLYALSGQPDKARVDEYDPVLDSWTLKNPLPDNNFWYSGVVSHNNELYRFGGGGYAAPVTSVHKYDQINDSWTNIASLPVALHAPAAASLNGTIFIAGGYAGGAETNAVRSFDANALTFNNAPSLPVARSYHELVTIGSCIYSVGGNNNSVAGVPTSLLRYCKTPVNTVALNEMDLHTFLKIYPNPTSGIIRIQNNSLLGTIELQDVTGKVVLKYMTNSSSAEIDLGTIDAGVYFLKVESEGKIFHKKIIKE